VKLQTANLAFSGFEVELGLSKFRHLLSELVSLQFLCIVRNGDIATSSCPLIYFSSKNLPIFFYFFLKKNSICILLFIIVILTMHIKGYSPC
jgi:hypothetical protein